MKDNIKLEGLDKGINENGDELRWDEYWYRSWALSLCIDLEVGLQPGKIILECLDVDVDIKVEKMQKLEFHLI